MKVKGPENTLLDTEEMIAITRNIGTAWEVYITRDYDRVYAVYFLPDTGVQIQRVEGEALRNLAQHSGDIDLLKAAELLKRM